MKSSLTIVSTIGLVILSTSVITNAQQVSGNKLGIKGPSSFVNSYSSDWYDGNDTSGIGALLYIGKNNDFDHPYYGSVYGASGLVVGQLNVTGANDSLLLGTGNTLGGKYNSVFGTDNTVNRAPAGYSQNPNNNTLVNGTLNTINGATDSFIAGHENIFERTYFSGSSFNSSNDDSIFYSSAIGWQNLINGAFGLAHGFSNEIKADGGIALGSKLDVDTFETVVVGTANKPITGARAEHRDLDPVFIIGNGSSDTDRSNALVVLKNGNVIIPKPQGDISMGIFGASSSSPTITDTSLPPDTARTVGSYIVEWSRTGGYGGGTLTVIVHVISSGGSQLSGILNTNYYTDGTVDTGSMTLSLTGDTFTIDGLWFETAYPELRPSHMDYSITGSSN